jgi:uncharacterized protein YndB with AHSA1/START domain
MTATDEGAPVLVVRRQIAVPRERVFAAWLDSESLALWMRPMDCAHATVTVDHHGEYLAIEPPSVLSFTWISPHTDHRPTVVTIEFHERGTGTELVLTHRRLPPKEVEGHRKGWTDIVRLLDEALTRG